MPNKIKILKKLVNELETKLLENKLPVSLNELKTINNKEIIPELLQSECNAKEIYHSVIYFLKNPEMIFLFYYNII